MNNLIEATLNEYYELVGSAKIDLKTEKNLGTESPNEIWIWFSYNGFNDIELFKLKLRALEMIIEYVIRNKLSFFTNETIFGHDVLVQHNFKDLYSPSKKPDECYVTNKLSELLEFIIDNNQIYTHSNLVVMLDGELIDINKVKAKYVSEISKFINIVYDSIAKLIAIEQDYIKLRRQILGTPEEKNQRMIILNRILIQVGVTDSFGNCILHLGKAKNNKSILWTIKDVFVNYNFLPSYLGNSQYMKLIWSYIKGGSPTPVKRHNINIKTTEENLRIVEKAIQACLEKIS